MGEIEYFSGASSLFLIFAPGFETFARTPQTSS